VSEFPYELIERCAKAVRHRQLERNGMGKSFDPDVKPTEGELDNASAVLRESGHAELVEALKPFAKFGEQYHRQPIKGIGGYTTHPGTEFEAEVTMDDFMRALEALRKAGAI